jgi:hypothetical protein
MTGSGTFFLRVQFPIPVSIIGFGMTLREMSNVQSVGIYSDAGSGTAPHTLVGSTTYTNGPPGNAFIPMTPVRMPAGYAWIAMSCWDTSSLYCWVTTYTDTAYFVTDCMPVSVAGGSPTYISPAMTARWSCP